MPESGIHSAFVKYQTLVQDTSCQFGSLWKILGNSPVFLSSLFFQKKSCYWLFLVSGNKVIYKNILITTKMTRFTLNSSLDRTSQHRNRRYKEEPNEILVLKNTVEIKNSLVFRFMLD